MRLTRRKFIGSMAVLGAGAAMPAWAQESVFDMFSTGRVLRETDKEGNTAAAAASIATNAPTHFVRRHAAGRVCQRCV
jgi:hypothetical protein